VFLRTSLFVLLLLLPLVRGATVSGPVLGYAVTGDHVRLIPGIPGAAYIGRALEVRAADVRAIAPESGYAIVSAGETGIRLVGLAEAREGARWDCPQGIVESVRLSPLGTAAVVVCSDAVARTLTGLPSEATVRSEFRLADGETQVRAVSDDGNLLTVVRSDDSIALVHNGELTTVATTGRVSDIRFLEATNDVLYTDRRSAQVGRMRNGSVSILASAADGLKEPAAAAYTGPESRRVLVIAETDKKLSIQDGTLPSVSIPAPCVPAALERLNPSTLRLVCVDDPRVFVVHASLAGVRVLAVPEGGE